MAEEMTHESYTVSGMTCGHCAMSVTEEVQELDGVSNVVVDHESGSLTFDASAPVSREQVAAAVEEAGYTLV